MAVVISVGGSLAAMRGIDPSLEESSFVLGGNQLVTAFRITLPLLKPSIFLCFVIGIINSFTSFDLVFVMTQGGPVYSTESLVYFLMNKFQNLQLGYASAIAYVLFIILVIFSLIQYRFFSERD